MDVMGDVDVGVSGAEARRVGEKLVAEVKVEGLGDV